ncbi:MAG: ferredoxin family protein [Planctomycetaceae bacterium]|nr:ferredoxin family protein [Planctomycetaceae bacterium]
MAAPKVTVVISQAQGRNPAKRQLEEDIATTLMMKPGINVSLVPHLYDMAQDHSGMLFLRSVPGPLIVLGWLYERAIRWTLDRAGIRGQERPTLLVGEDADDKDDEDEPDEFPDDNAGIGSTDVPHRAIYCIDLRVAEDAVPYAEEIERIVRELTDEAQSAPTMVGFSPSLIPEPQRNVSPPAEPEPPSSLMSWIQGSPQPEQLERYLHPERMLEARRAFDSGTATTTDRQSLPEDTGRRWYPVIDYSRCTNCMECIDFCLFGVYGVDALDRILVEQQDNCKKGCPACSRVCPADAIMFPQHKTPAIAGAAGEVSGLKIDLSELFGGDNGESPLEMAVKERDRELILDGRDAVGMSVGIHQKDRDEVDRLLSELVALEF